MILFVYSIMALSSFFVSIYHSFTVNIMQPRELKDYFLKIEYFSEDEQIFPKCKTYFNKEMERGIKKSKVKKIKLHALRHSHISLLIEMGFTPVDIAARTGHESMKVLMDYNHMFPNKQLDMADKLNKEGEYSESTKISKL